MKNFAGLGVSSVLVCSVACGPSDDAKTSPASARTEKPVGARPTWPKASCTILASESVAKIIGKVVKPREQYAICDYLTGDSIDDISVHYYNNKGGGGEYEIFKGLQAERGGKSTPVAGLGKEALEGNSGTGAGLAVQMADGRSFMVANGRSQEHRRAVAELVLAVR